MGRSHLMPVQGHVEGIRGATFADDLATPLAHGPALRLRLIEQEELVNSLFP